MGKPLFYNTSSPNELRIHRHKIEKLFHRDASLPIHKIVFSRKKGTCFFES